MPAYRYLHQAGEHAGDYYEGVPGRDLTAEEFDRLTDEQKDDVRSTKPYALYVEIDDEGNDVESNTEEGDGRDDQSIALADSGPDQGDTGEPMATATSDLPLPDDTQHAIVDSGAISDQLSTFAPIEEFHDAPDTGV